MEHIANERADGRCVWLFQLSWPEIIKCFFQGPKAGWPKTFLSFDSQVQVSGCLFAFDELCFHASKKKLYSTCAVPLLTTVLSGAHPPLHDLIMSNIESANQDRLWRTYRRAAATAVRVAALLAWVARSSREFDSNSVSWLYFWDNWVLSVSRDASHPKSEQATLPNEELMLLYV